MAEIEDSSTQAPTGLHPQEEPVCTVWEQTAHAAMGLFLVVSAGLLIHYYPTQAPTSELQAQISTLTSQVRQLTQEQAMPTLVLNRYRNSIAYVFGIYRVGYEGRRPLLRARISGTGFVVGNRLLATNRHVAEPWYEDPDSALLLRQGAVPKLEKLVAFFPGMATPVDLTPVGYSAQGDVAIAEIEDSEAVRRLQALPLEDAMPTPGELVSVVGYPMGILGMVAKSPPAVYDRLAYRHDDQGAASEFAALSLIRPSATCGHLGDVVGDKLIYDAPTAHGGSGGPVFDSRGKVIGINAAYLDGFSGGTMGVSVRALKPLIAAAEKP
jgi:S1-C subfamily serine protease